MRKVSKSKFSQLEDNDIRAQEDYDNLFYDLESDSEEGTNQQDFYKLFQHSDLATN